MHDELIFKIINRHFHTQPSVVTRKTTGLCNEVYEAKLPDQSVIVRIGVTNNNLLGSSKYIPMFQQQGINVPELLAEDYTGTFIPYPYHVLSMLEGQDLPDVIAELNHDQLTNLAHEIAHIVKTLEKLPTNGKFGWVGADELHLVDSLTIEIENELQRANERMRQTGIFDEDLWQKVNDIFQSNKTYFDNAKSLFYYDDLNSKNVMIHAGKFNGLVDLDGVKYGDPIQSIGAIRANWPGTEYGDFYTEQVMKALDLTNEQKRLVDVYAVIHRYSWMSENGIQFNANTQAAVNQDKLARDKEIISFLV
ncbi:MAG TPA: aminoglycoside phosphotransferase family protein [Patescibacteria group bacterium]